MVPPITMPTNIRHPNAITSSQHGRRPQSTFVFHLSLQFFSFHDFSEAGAVVSESIVSDGGRSARSCDVWDGASTCSDSWLGVGDAGTPFANAANAFSFSLGYLE
jgi:hypothetical protein